MCLKLFVFLNEKMLQIFLVITARSCARFLFSLSKVTLSITLTLPQRPENEIGHGKFMECENVKTKVMGLRNESLNLL